MKTSNLFGQLTEMFFAASPCAQVQDILRVAKPISVTSLQFKLVLRPKSWESHEGSLREISIMRSELHYIDVICSQSNFTDSVHAVSMPEAMNAIYRYLSAQDIVRSKLFDAASVYAKTLDGISNITVSDCADRIIIRDTSVNYISELHVIQTKTNLVTLKLYADGELMFCSVPNSDKDLVDKATYILFGKGPVEDALPKLLLHEVKAVNMILEKHNVKLDENSITFTKENFLAFVGDLIRHKTSSKI